MIPANLKRQHLPLLLKAGGQVAAASFPQMRKCRIVVPAFGSFQDTHAQSTKNHCGRGRTRFCERRRSWFCYVVAQVFNFAVAGALEVFRQPIKLFRLDTQFDERP